MCSEDLEGVAWLGRAGGGGLSMGSGALQMRVNIAGSVVLFAVIMSSEDTVGEN